MFVLHDFSELAAPAGNVVSRLTLQSFFNYTIYLTGDICAAYRVWSHADLPEPDLDGMMEEDAMYFDEAGDFTSELEELKSALKPWGNHVEEEFQRILARNVVPEPESDDDI